MMRALSALALLTASGGVLADEVASYYERRAQEDLATFQQIDRDGSGRVAREAASGFVDFVARFSDMDTDRDGYVTRAELKAYHDRQRPAQTAKAK
ncbi:MAG: hypothetical protein ACOZDY_10510 [Pseudomonadota bacterium]